MQSDNLVAVLRCLKEVQFFGGCLHQSGGLCNALFQLFFRHVKNDGVGGKGSGCDRFGIGFVALLFRTLSLLAQVALLDNLSVGFLHYHYNLPNK